MSNDTQLIAVAEDEKAFLASKTVSSNTHLRSDMAQEFISRRPDFFERWALFIFSGILLVLLIVSWFFRYPDVILSSTTLTAANAPKEIVTRTEGRLVQLFVNNDQPVKRGDMIGWIESTASHKEILTLSRLIDSSIHLMESNNGENVSNLFRERFNQLGELQTNYQQFIAAWQQFNDYTANGFYARKKKLLEKDIQSVQQMIGTVEEQKKLLTEELSLAEESYKMNDDLLKEKIISKEQYRLEKGRFLSKQSSLPQIKGSLISYHSQQREKLKEIQQIEHDALAQQTVFFQSLQSLKSALDDWIKKFVLQAPIDGKVFYIIPLQENQYLYAAKLLGYVNPVSSNYYAETYLPQANFGKIDTGLKVQLRFEAYPYQEFGHVNGIINYVSTVASDSGFLATIRLDDGLITNQHKAIAYKNGLKAQGVIITKDMRLLERLYYDFVKATSISNK